jgi:hypothetical protein
VDVKQVYPGISQVWIGVGVPIADGVWDQVEDLVWIPILELVWDQVGSEVEDEAEDRDNK